MTTAQDQNDKTTLKHLALTLGALVREAKELDLPTVVIIEGLDGSGKGLLLNKIILEIDARSYDISSTHAGDKQARKYPLLWRIAQNTPQKGRLQFYDRSAYYLTLDAWADDRIHKNELPYYWEDIQKFERQLTDDGVHLIKIFLTVSQKEQAKRFTDLEKNPSTAWRVRKKDWKRNKQYDAQQIQIARLIDHTHKSDTPWFIINTDEIKKATFAVYEVLIQSYEQAIQKQKLHLNERPQPRDWIHYTGPDYIAQIDLAKSLDRALYKRRLKARQSEMYDLVHEIHDLNIPVVMVYCGADAAGKGGCIKRLLQGIDPRSFTVIPVGAPTKEEIDHHYLWRFWKKLPPRGKISIFDRSWYGRVLVERVEQLCTNEEWQRAYHEINEFESHLTSFGTVVIKFWLHIDSDTQLERFKARQNNPHKQWKITDDDWRNREKAHLYREATNEMIDKTNTRQAPWHIIPSTSKHHARIETLDLTIAHLKSAIKKARQK